MEDRAARLQWLHKFVQQSHHRQEVVSEKGDSFQEEIFPKKGYGRYLTPISREQERELERQQLAADSKKNGKPEPKPDEDSEVRQKKMLKSFQVEEDIAGATFFEKVKRHMSSILLDGV
jgi:hypothetical protein